MNNPGANCADQLFSLNSVLVQFQNLQATVIFLTYYIRNRLTGKLSRVQSLNETVIRNAQGIYLVHTQYPSLAVVHHAVPCYTMFPTH